MKRNERNNYNHIARDIRKNGIESIINIEVPTNYTHEARQAFHELLTAYNLRAVCIYWNDVEKTWALHYEPARYTEAHDEKRRQEAEDVDTVTARMTRRNWTWNGYPAPADQAEAEPAQEAPQEAPAAEAEQQPTETENAPQAATQAAEGTAQQADELDKLRNLRDALKTAPTPDTIRTALDAIRQHDPETELTEDDSPRAIKSELQHIINGIGLDAYMEQGRAQRAPWPADADTDTEEEEEEETMHNTFTPAEAAMHEATARGIIRRKGGYRERDLLNHPHTIERGTWTTEHKVVEILSTTPDPDGYRPGCAVDIVTRSIVG